VYQVPALRGSSGFVKALTGGWQLNGVLTLQSGLPFTVNAGVDRSLAGVNRDRADVHGSVAIYNGKSHVEKTAKYFDTSAYSLPALGTFGTSSRNSLRAPGIDTLDAGIFKNVELHNDKRLELRWEAFNALNHPNFLAPNSSFTSANFGKITSTSRGRVMQVAAKIVF
jgi:hypothetical protein